MSDIVYNLTGKFRAGYPPASQDYVDNRLIEPFWDDLKFPFTQTKQGANLKPAFDYTNVGIDFVNSAATEIVYIIAQFPHSRKADTSIRPHIHWKQTNAIFPTFKMDYKWFNNGDVVPANWITLSTNTGSFSYVEGITQISNFGDIVGTGKGLSSIMIIRLYRDDNAFTGSALGYEFDIHYQNDSRGSAQEYIK